MYVVDDEHLLMVASDRVSAFDVIMREPIPGKGRVLTALSKFWFERTREVVPNHFVSQANERALVVRRADRIDIECVVRGYLAGSGWAEYRAKSTLADEPLPAGLSESQQLPEPRFTPAIKAETGHDQNISRAQLCSMLGADLATRLESLSLALYAAGASHAASRGLILADTKFEFGTVRGELILIDELLTPDSSRYWPREGYAPGRPQPSFDKQFLRDFLESVVWDKTPPPPPLPADVVEGTRERYEEALRRLTA
jgi:phosphoribosylaminoimidazole-succinocarboxamide synthase